MDVMIDKVETMIKEREEREDKLFETLLQDARRGLEEITASDHDTSHPPCSGDQLDESREEETRGSGEDSSLDGEEPRED